MTRSPFITNSGACGGSGKQRQRAAGAERLLLGQILDPDAEARAVAEVIFDHVPEVVDREKDPPHALADEMKHDPLEDRSPRDAQHRLGQLIGQRRQSLTAATGHDHRPVRPIGHADHVAQQVQPGEPALAVDDRNLLDVAGLHEIDHLGPTGARSDRDEVALHVVRDAIADGEPTQHHAPDVAIGHDADELSALVDDQRDVETASLQRDDGVANRAR